MRNIYRLLAAGFIVSLAAVIYFSAVTINSDEKNFDYRPSEWFTFQRAYPYDAIPVEKYFKAVRHTEKMKLSKRSLLGEWYPVGPYNIGGRITALDVDPIDNNTIYAGAAAGGVFKTTNGGAAWIPLTDFFPSLSIGALKIDPNNPNIIYCGTGEANASGDSYPGFGMLKSTDKGVTWFLSGLENSRHIAEIEVHPLNSNLIYTSVTGGLYSKDDNRGIYKSTDAGKTWQRVLFLADSISAIDVAVDPSDQNRVYAAVWDRMRGPTFRKVAGTGSGIFLSTDGGNSWEQLTNGLPVFDSRIGRISIAVSKSNPNYVYALYKSSTSPNGSDNNFFGFYRSTDKGMSWTKMPDENLPGQFYNFGWYFGLIEVDPNDHNKVYIGEIDLFRTTDGGQTWKNLTNSYSVSFEMQHPDQHALWINPQAANHLIVGNDGGVFTSLNDGLSWDKLYDLPISQFYASTIDYLLPHRKYGGTQDNGTMRTADGSLDKWAMLFGGDGFHCQVNYTNSNIIYVESQYGNIAKSTNGGLNFSLVKSGITDTRTNWSTPFILDTKDPSILYYGTYRIFRTTNAAQSWLPISTDLTRGPNGRLGTITAISAAVASDSVNRIIYVGTDDAKISLTTNTGTSWTDITGNLPNRYITDVVVDQRNPAAAYVTLSGFNLDLNNAHVFRTTNYGSSWINITGSLPDVPVNSLIIDYDSDSLLYIGCDVGVFYTTDLGASWNVLGSGLPNSPVFDLNYHQPTKKLVAATHGRSMYEFDLSVLSGVNDEQKILSSMKFALKQNYPNPFNPSTQIEFTIEKEEWVKLVVYNAAGRKINTLIDQDMPAGVHRISFNGERLASGVYFYQLNAGRYSETKKMVLMR